MNECEARRPAPLRCPSPAEVLESALALLPRGRAWQSNEGGPVAGYDPPFAAGPYSDAFAIGAKRGSTLRKFWQAVADVFAFVNQRLCDLRLEFWCATHSETNDLWMAEYGLPDPCDPFPDLCTKVAAIGGTRCEYYSEIAARAGWSISCDGANVCGTRLGDRTSQAGRAKPGRVRRVSTLTIRVNLGESPSYVSSGLRRRRPRAGCFKVGRRLSCDVDPTLIEIRPLECLLARVVHAEIQILYEVF